MNANRAVKNGFGGAGLHRHGKALHDFAGIRPHHVQADHPVGCVFHHQLHKRAFGAAAQRVLERLEIAAINADLAKFFAGIGLRKTDRSNIRMGKHRRRNKVVTHAARFLAFSRAEQLVNHHHRLAQRHRRELHPRCHVTERINGRHGRLVLVIHLNGTSRVLLDTGRFQAQVLDPRHPASGIQHRIDGEVAAIE